MQALRADLSFHNKRLTSKFIQTLSCIVYASAVSHIGFGSYLDRLLGYSLLYVITITAKCRNEYQMNESAKYYFKS